MAAAPLRLGENINEDPTCSICLELFTRPKVLPCQHTFCQDCLQNLAGREKAVKCPNCRHVARVPSWGVTGFPDNQHVASICEELKDQGIPSQEIQSLPPASTIARRHQDGHREWRHRVTFGGRGSETGQFNYPTGVAVSAKGEIFVADCLNERIQVFTLQGAYVRQFPTVVSDTEKMHPHDVAMYGKKNLWVVGSKFSVQYTIDGDVLRTFGVQNTRWFRGVGVDTRRNHILVTKTTGEGYSPQGEVLVFNLQGGHIRTFGEKILVTSTQGQEGLKHPWYITKDDEGNSLMSDYGNHCVHAYNKKGRFLFKFGVEGNGEGQLKGPQGICSDGGGNIIVADSGNSRVELFDKRGRFLEHITTEISEPSAVAMVRWQLVVTDCRNHTVIVFDRYYVY